MSREDHAKRRRASLEEIERYRVKLLTLGAHCGKAVEGTAEGLLTLLDDALSLSPTEAVQSGFMYWIDAYRAQSDLVSGIWKTLTEPKVPVHPRAAIIDGKITFFLDQFSEASAPVRTQIAKTEDVSASDLVRLRGPEVIPGERVAFSGPSDPSPTYAVSLSKLEDLMSRLPEGTYRGRLTWRGGSQVIQANLTKTPED